MHKTCKSIKKAAKITAYVTLCLLLLLASVLFFLQTPYASAKILDAAKKAFTEQTKSKISIGSIHVDFFNRLTIKELYVADIHGDTLLYAKKINVRIAAARLLHHEIVIKKATLRNIDFRLAIDSTKMLNLSYLIQSFTSHKVDTTKKPSKWKLDLQSVELVGSKFRLHHYNAPKVKRGFNAQDISVVYLNVKVSKFRIQHDSVLFDINRLMAVEQSGFYLKRLKAKFSICSRHLNFEDIHFETPQSTVDASKVHLLFKSFALLSENFIKNVKFDGEIQPSKVNFADIAYFAPTLWGLRSTVNISGKVSGPIAELRGKNIQASFGELSKVEGNFDFTGLPNIYETFIFADIKLLNTNIPDINYFLKGHEGKAVEFPEILNKFGIVAYKGKFTGFINDFVAYGNFSTALGSIIADLSLKPGSNKTIKFQGKLATDGFKLGVLAGIPTTIGQISFSAKADGMIEKGLVSAKLDASVSKIQLKNYKYSNINILGTLDKKSFTGLVNVNDSNLYLKFDGTANFQNAIPDFHFLADVNAKLYPLGLSQDTTLAIQSSIDANFAGKNFDDINGSILLTNSQLSHKNQKIKIEKITASSSFANNTRSITLESDIAKANITGQFTLPQLIKESNNWINRYTPSLVNANIPLVLPQSKKNSKKQKEVSKPLTSEAKTPLGELNISVDLVNTDDLFSFFAPTVKLGRKTAFRAHYSGATGKMQISGSSSHLLLGNTLFQQIAIHGDADMQNLNLTTSSRYLFNGEDTLLQHISIKNQLHHDTTQWDIQWIQNRDSSKKSKISARSIFANSPEKGTQMSIMLNPGNIYANDSIWKIEKSSVFIDSTAIRFNNVSLNHGNQFIRINGNISKKQTDTLYCNINNMRINMLDVLIKNPDIKLDGELYGRASLTDLFNKPTIQCDARVENFNFNKEALGTATILSEWDQDAHELHLNAYVQKGTLKTIAIRGVYFPENKSLNFTSHLEKARIAMLQPFVRGIFSNLSGIITGDATIEGFLNKPDINGNLRLQKIAFKVDYLNTNYNFNSDLVIKNNAFILPNTKIYDSNGNTCDAKMIIDNQYFKNLTIDAQLKPDNLICLNTTEDDNSLFYGSAFATGDIHIYGPFAKLTLDITAKTNKNTRIFIPLNKQSEARENKFVSFLKPATHDSIIENILAKKKNEYRVNTNGLMLNFKLDVTPDAELQLIFDKRVGDIIKGKGYGNIEMEINTLGKFAMYGDFRITKGEYLFTLKNLINKRFTVEENGHIQWNGSPIDAEVDLTAVYALKASLANYLGGTSGEYSSRTPVECKLNMQGKLTSPRIKYSIELPTSTEETKSKLRTALSNEDELDKQFVTLLIGRTFYSSGGNNSSTSTNNVGSSAARSLPSEFLSNQFNNLLSQATDKVDIGVNYQPGDEETTQQLEVALSTQLFNDRVTVSTNIGKAGSQTATTTTGKQSTDVVGDFNVDYKVTESGRLHLKAFNRTNDQSIYEQSAYTQGVGIFHRGEFNSFRELFKKRKKVELKEDEQDSLPSNNSKTKKDSTDKKAILPTTKESKEKPQP